MALLEIDSLTVSYGTQAVLRGVSFHLDRGEIVALCGESGSGKSSTAHAVTRLLPRGAQLGGKVLLDGTDLLTQGERQMCAVRGGRIGMVFQDPAAALNPVRRIGEQIGEVLTLHGVHARAEIQARVRAVMAHVGLTAAGVGPERFAHQLSGGQCQRVCIAMALIGAAPLIVADEPTTALDVGIQAQILSLLRKLAHEDGHGVLLITHDLGVVGEYADRVALMENGAIVECAPVSEIFHHPKTALAKRLIAATRMPTRREAPQGGAEIVRVDGVRHRFAPQSGWVLNDVGFSLSRGESLGIVGESGSGKTTLLKTVLGLVRPTMGTVTFGARSWANARGMQERILRRDIQAVFQNPYTSFDPRHRIGRIVGEPLHLLGTKMTRGERDRAVAGALETVGMPTDAARRFAQNFSGGQLQRIAIARALILSPALVTFDEALSALDAAARLEILTLLNDLNARLGVSYLFVTHDLDQARAVTDRVIVMQNGRIVESGPTGEVLRAPQHPYTAGLLAAAPNPARVLGMRSTLPVG